MDINDKVARCRILATLVVADDVVEIEELELLENTMAKLDLTEEEKAQVMVLLDEDDAIAALDSLDDEERLQFLEEMAEAAWVDGDLDEYEVEQIRKIVGHMALTEEDLKAALKKATPGR